MTPEYRAQIHAMWAAAGSPSPWYVSRDVHAAYEKALMKTVGQYQYLALNKAWVQIDPVPREMQLPEGF